MAKGIQVADSRPLETTNRPDEWKIEQGLHGAKIPFLDQTGATQVEILPREWPKEWKDEAAIRAVGDPEVLFKAERVGWKG
jgi:sulfite oxidase